MLTAEDLTAIRLVVREELASLLQGTVPRAPAAVVGSRDDEWLSDKEAAALLGYAIPVMRYATSVQITRHGDSKTARYLRRDLLEYMERRESLGWMTIEAAESRLGHGGGGYSWVRRRTFPRAVRNGRSMIAVLEVEAEWERRRPERERRAALTPEQRRAEDEAIREEARRAIERIRRDLGRDPRGR